MPHPDHDPMGTVSRQVRALLADRHSPEARALLQTLMVYIHRRVNHAVHSGQIGPTEVEEVVSEVMLDLVRGGLARFRGETIGELYAFVRVATDRTCWRATRRGRREQRRASAVEAQPELAQVARLTAPDARAEGVALSPLPAADQAYLEALLSAGSKAELARRAGVSRAAVTQRIQRILQRVATLTAHERSRHEVWLEQAAGRALAESDEPRPFSH
jgi:DNA-directed RNA polymerase specialized sigma24 family protein